MRYLGAAIVSVLVGVFLLWFGYAEAKDFASKTGERLTVAAAPVTRAIRATASNTVKAIPMPQIMARCVTFQSKFWCLPTVEELRRKV